MILALGSVRCARFPEAFLQSRGLSGIRRRECTCPEGDGPAAGTQSDDFLFVCLFGFYFILFGGGVGAVSSQWDWGTFCFSRLLRGGVALSHLLTSCFLAQKGTRITELLGHY